VAQVGRPSHVPCHGLPVFWMPVVTETGAANDGSPWHGRRAGFTLLEVVLALSIMATITTLVAALWAQARSWGDQNASHLRALNTARVIETAQRQWTDRRQAVDLGVNGVKVTARPERIEFVTATPILRPDWPIVQAGYVIEPDAAGPGDTCSLWYEEARVWRFGETTQFDRQQITNPATGDEQPLRLRVLSGVRGLRFERFGAGDLPQGLPIQEARARATPEQRRLTWRKFEKLYKGPLPAVRLVGDIDAQEFTCVFVIELSR